MAYPRSAPFGPSMTRGPEMVRLAHDADWWPTADLGVLPAWLVGG